MKVTATILTGGPDKRSVLGESKIQIQCLSFAVINRSMIPKLDRFQTKVEEIRQSLIDA